MNRYLYNGKELITDHNLNIYDYGARGYDPTIGRWSVVDPLAAQFPSWAPYSFSFNNPMRFIDPDGRAPFDIVIKGQNNSSITIVTDLIDVSVDAGSIVGDLGGNYSLEGNDVLVAALDIVGIVAPTGVADMAAAALEAQQGNWGSAVLSAIGVVPLVGDLGKVGKIGKHVKTINNAIEGTKSADNAKALARQGRSGKQARG